MPIKILHFVLLLVLATGCSVEPTDDELVSESSLRDRQPDSHLSAAQARLVLTLLDDACADAWCEGDYSWSFKKIVCKPGLCTLTMLVTDPATEQAPARFFWRSCHIPGFSHFADLVNTAPNGYQSLTTTFFSSVDTCITDLEQTIPKPP